MVDTYDEQLALDRISLLVRDLEDAQKRIESLKVKIEKQRAEMSQLMRQFNDLLEGSKDNGE